MSHTKLIADCCRNHLGNNEIIQKMIHEAAFSGADYVKFQIYNSRRLNKRWSNYSDKVCELMRHQLSDFQISEIINTCEKLKVIPMFTIFSLDRLDFLKVVFSNHEVALKIASPDMSNYTLIDNIVKNFPQNRLFISTGMHTPAEIKDAKETYNIECPIWLYCVSQYPALFADIDFYVMQFFDGFSDHTMGIAAAQMAIDKGMEYIEKHFTLSRNLPGTDQHISIEPHELKLLRRYADEKYIQNLYKKRWNAELIP